MWIVSWQCKSWYSSRILELRSGFWGSSESSCSSVKPGIPVWILEFQFISLDSKVDTNFRVLILGFPYGSWESSWSWNSSVDFRVSVWINIDYCVGLQCGSRDSSIDSVGPMLEGGSRDSIVDNGVPVFHSGSSIVSSPNIPFPRKAFGTHINQNFIHFRMVNESVIW